MGVPWISKHLTPNQFKKNQKMTFVSETQRLEYIAAHNLMAIDEAKIDFSAGDIHVLSGGNGVGKTTLSGTIHQLLADRAPEKPLADGKMAGFYKAKLESGVVIYYQFDEDQAGGLLTIRDPEGKPLSKAATRAFLRNLAGNSGQSFDLDAFLRETQPKEQRKMLMQLVNVDLDQYDEKVKAAEDERRDANRQVRDQKARAGEYDESLADQDLLEPRQLVEEKNRMLEHNRLVQGKKDKADTNLETQGQVARRIEGLERQLQEARTQLQELEGQHAELSEWLKTPANAPHPQADLEAIDKQLQHADTQNDAIRNARQMKREHEQLQALEAVASEKQAAVEAAQQERMEAVKAAKLPADGLEFSADGGLLLHGQPLAQACAGDRAVAGLQIKAQELGALRYVSFDASHLDYHNTRKVLKWAVDNDLQLAVEIAERSADRQGLTIEVASVYYGES